MPVQRGVGDLLHQFGIGDREVGLDLAEDALFFLGERHGSHHCRAVQAAQQRGVGESFPTLRRSSGVLAGGGRATGGETARSEAGGDHALVTVAAAHAVDRPLQRRAAAVARRGGVVERPGAAACCSPSPIPVPASCCTETPSSRTPSATSTASSRARAVVPMSAARSVAVASVRERVIVRKSAKRTLSCTVRPRGRWLAAASRCGRRAARPRGRARRDRCGRPGRSPRGRPTSRTRSGSTARGRRCAASAWRWRPRASPSAATSVASPKLGEIADGAQAESVAASRRVAGPTPHSRSTGSGWRNASSVARRDHEQAVGLGEVATRAWPRTSSTRRRPTP